MKFNTTARIAILTLLLPLGAACSSSNSNHPPSGEGGSGGDEEGGSGGGGSGGGGRAGGAGGATGGASGGSGGERGGAGGSGGSSMGGSGGTGGMPKPEVDAAVPSTKDAAMSTNDSGGSKSDSSTPASDAGGSPASGIVVLAAGDISGSGGSMTQTAALASTLMKTKPVAALLTLGDHAYDSNTLSEFNQYYTPSWGAPELLNITHPAPGNHEYQTSNAKGYFDYFNGAGMATGRAGDRTKGYYSYDLGGWHFLALNTNDECGVVACDAGSAQVAWIKAELADAKNKFTVAYMHHPRFQEGIEHADTSAAKGLWDALYDGGADIVLAGHEHNFQQFGPMDKAGKLDTVKRMRSWVVGTGGIDHYVGFNTAHKDAEEFKNDTKFGLLELTLAPSGEYSWRFVAVGGTVLVMGSDHAQ